MKQLLCTLMLLSLLTSKGFSQLRYLLRLFEKDDEKIIQIWKQEKSGSKMLYQEKNAMRYDEFRSIQKKYKVEDLPVSAQFLKQMGGETKLSATSGKKALNSKALLDRATLDQMEGERHWQQYLHNNSAKTGETYISIPSNEKEFENIFGGLNSRQLMKSRKISDDIKKDHPFETYLTKSANDFLKGLNKDSKKTVILIGHNSGGKFHFPDGSKLSFSEIDESAKKNKRIVVFLSCNSNRYTASPSVNQYITYEQALGINDHLRTAFMDIKPTNQEETISDIQFEIDDYLYLENVNARIKAIAYFAGGSAAAYGLYIIRKD